MEFQDGGGFITAPDIPDTTKIPPFKQKRLPSKSSGLNKSHIDKTTRATKPSSVSHTRNRTGRNQERLMNLTQNTSKSPFNITQTNTNYLGSKNNFFNSKRRATFNHINSHIKANENSKISQIKSFLDEHEKDILDKKEQFKKNTSEFNKALTENFLLKRKQIIADTMDRLYEKEREKVTTN